MTDKWVEMSLFAVVLICLGIAFRILFGIAV